MRPTTVQEAADLLKGFERPVRPVGGGTKPHDVAGRAHPGAKANFYRKSAYESRKVQIGEVTLSVMGVEMQKAIAKEAARMAGKGKR